MSLFDKDRKAALNCLKLIRETMKVEYHYYNKSKIIDVIWNSNKYTTYKNFIDDAFVKQINPNAYSTLFSNLYDVSYYGNYYYGRTLREKEAK